MSYIDTTGESYWMGPKPKKGKRKQEPLFGDYGASSYGPDFGPSWVGENKPVIPRGRSSRKAYRKPQRSTVNVYINGKRKTRRKKYVTKRKQLTTSDYIKGAYKGSKVAYKGAKTTYKGAKKTYKKASKFISEKGKPKAFGAARSLRDRLRGSIYKKEK